MAAGRPLFAGFDLGTTNSAAAVFDGSEVSVVRNGSGAALTPSVVRIDGRGRVTVGQQAARFAARDPDNTVREFKRLMGTAERLRFAASGESRLPQELGALVLQALRKDVEDVTGVLPARAVVSVPALFELPQSKATAQAAHAAGFEQVELLQEPIASALAAGWKDDEPGAWIVYDLGGGTFDVSLLETRDGLLRIVGHDGDNFLGGRDFDRVIVDWAIGRLGARIERKNPEQVGVLRALQHAAEAAKIELSRAHEADLVLEEPLRVDGRDLELDLTLDRDTLERLCAPLVARSIAVCKRLLAAHGLAADQLSRVVLVGGPSVMPMVRREVERGVGAAIATGHDPMTLVAQGAALYAATAGLDARQALVAEHRPGRRKLWCQYPPVSADLEPHVIGKFEAGLPAGTTVQLLREGWQSEPVAIDTEDSFVVSALLQPRRLNRMTLVVTGPDGTPIETEPDHITIVQGLTIGDPPLGRSIGVALASNTVHTYFERGTALPARRTFTHHTVDTVPKGSPDSVLEVPIVQGEFEDAHLCQLVGKLSIIGREVDRTIPSGSPVELTLLVDRGGRLTATARVGGQSFEGVAQLVMPEATAESLTRNLAAARDRVGTALAAAFRAGDAEFLARLQRLERELDEVSPMIDAVRGGDSDAGQRAARIILELDASLGEIEAERRWPDFEDDARETQSFAIFWVSEHGHETEQRLVDTAGRALDLALRRRSVTDATRQVRILRRVGSAAFRRDPKCWQFEFAYCVSRIEEATDLPKAKKLESKGKKALARSDNAELKAVVEQLRDLFPADPAIRRMSYESGVR